VSSPAAAAYQQPSFDDLGTPLSDLTFVVVDLETTGGSPTDCAITEIGAVKVRGGEPLGEFQTLVNPGQTIPAFIAVLTGITDALVAQAPPIRPVLASFLEFSQGCVLVAHNAPFDVGFLRTAAERQKLDWPRFPVVDTARLARRVLDRDEAPNCRLATLARLFRATTTPNHRALDDARATVDVLHGLFERLGCFGVTTWEDVEMFSRRVSPSQQRKRHLADAVPRGPGVYLFRDAEERILYIGKSVDMRSRVRQYFTASEQRRRMAEMVAVAHDVIGIACPTALEAEVRELRLIAEHKPAYNARSKFPEKAVFIRLTDEPFPRLSTVRKPPATTPATFLGPIGSARTAELVTQALHDAFPLRQCRTRLARQPHHSPCMLAGIGRCGSPCDGRQGLDDYARVVETAGAALRDQPHHVVDTALQRIAILVASQRYEQAAEVRDRMLAYVGALARAQQLATVTSCPLIAAAQPTSDGAWEVAVIRHGRLAATSRSTPGADPRPVVDALVAAHHEPAPTTAEETQRLARWLEHATTRLVIVDGTLASPTAGGCAAWHRLHRPNAILSTPVSFPVGQ